MKSVYWKKSRLLAIVAVLLWSTASTAFKLSLRSLTPFKLVFLASCVSLIILWTMVLVKKRVSGSVVFSGKRLAGASIRGLLNPFLYYLVLFEAYDRLPAQIAMVINYLWPITLLLLSIPFLRQRITSRILISSCISFCGVAVLVLGGNPAGGHLSITAMGLALLSTVIWAAFWIMNLRSSSNAVVTLAESFSFGIVYLVLFGLMTGRLVNIVQTDLAGIAGAVYVGVFEMGITFVIWQKALELAETTAEIGNLIYLTPFLALLFIGSVVGEQIGIFTVGGLLLVISGILLQERWKKKKVKQDLYSPHRQQKDM
ncbi:MAG: DMT family transporter [Candidatus Fermentibacteraceae bacterium]|nr:DMT family transporter [Candidatus Fermentibacteraceae bacterium]